MIRIESPHTCFEIAKVPTFLLLYHDYHYHQIDIGPGKNDTSRSERCEEHDISLYFVVMHR